MKRMMTGLVIVAIATLGLTTGASGQTGDTTTTTTIPQVDLPGENITAGTLTVGANFKTAIESNCTLSGDIGGQQLNIIRNEDQTIGAVYGKANVGAGTVGIVNIELGPLPLAVTAFRTTGGCNQDVVGIGGFDSTKTAANFEGIGGGLFPEDAATSISVHLTVGGTVAPANLNLQAAYDYLATKRPTS